MTKNLDLVSTLDRIIPLSNPIKEFLSDHFDYIHEAVIDTGHPVLECIPPVYLQGYVYYYQLRPALQEWVSTNFFCLGGTSHEDFYFDEDMNLEEAWLRSMDIIRDSEEYHNIMAEYSTRCRHSISDSMLHTLLESERAYLKTPPRDDVNQFLGRVAESVGGFPPEMHELLGERANLCGISVFPALSVCLEKIKKYLIEKEPHCMYQ